VKTRIIDWIRKALTKQVIVPANEAKTRAVRMEEAPPSEKLVLVVALTIAAIAVMTVLEVVHVIYLGVWNSEIFSAITSLAGLVVGTLIGAKT